jgi:hypothetical protein
VVAARVDPGTADAAGASREKRVKIGVFAVWIA